MYIYIHMIFFLGWSPPNPDWTLEVVGTIDLRIRAWVKIDGLDKRTKREGKNGNDLHRGLLDCFWIHLKCWHYVERYYRSLSLSLSLPPSYFLSVGFFDTHTQKTWYAIAQIGDKPSRGITPVAIFVQCLRCLPQVSCKFQFHVFVFFFTTTIWSRGWTRQGSNWRWYFPEFHVNGTQYQRILHLPRIWNTCLESLV